MVSIKEFGQNKKFLWEKFVKKKKNLQNILYCAKFLIITMLSWYFKIINVYQCFFSLNIFYYMIDWTGDTDMKKKKFDDIAMTLFWAKK